MSFFSVRSSITALVPCLGAVIGFGSRADVLAPGGHEVFCNGSTEVHELWPSIPTGGVPWKVAAGPQTTQIAVGFPPPGVGSTLPAVQRPALQSICRAARSWNNVKVPYPPTPGQPNVLPMPVPVASTFKFAPNPTSLLVWNSFTENDRDRMVRDGTSLVTCHQSEGWWQLVGGPTALASAFVFLSGGDIVEGDIALNVKTLADQNTRQPVWSFTEANDTYQLTYGTHPFDRNTQPYTDPRLGYADMQGVLTHEFGHVAGLGHSLVDSSQSGAESRFPTMFPFAQVEPYTATHSFWTGTDANGNETYLAVPADGDATVFGGSLGKSGRSLELDDISAIADAYPAAAFTTELATITGTCFLGNLASPVRGAHVVAFRSDSPDDLRIGTLSFAGGVYTLRGLPPGTWYVYAEPVDQPPPPFTAGGFYFGGFDVPNYVFQGSSGCITSQPFFGTEFWDSAEAFNEGVPSRATTITVTRGQVVSGIDFHLDAGTDFLTMRVQQTPALHASGRGVIVAPQLGVFPTVQAIVQMPSTLAGRPVSLVFSTARVVSSFAQQLVLPSSTGSTTLTGVLDVNGRAVFTFPTATIPVQTNYFAQAIALGAGSTSIVSNSLNLWMASR